MLCTQGSAENYLCAERTPCLNITITITEILNPLYSSYPVALCQICQNNKWAYAYYASIMLAYWVKSDRCSVAEHSDYFAQSYRVEYTRI